MLEKAVVIREGNGYFLVMEDIWDIIDSMQRGLSPMKELKFNARVPGLIDYACMSIFVRLEAVHGVKKFTLCKDTYEVTKPTYEAITLENQKLVKSE